MKRTLLIVAMLLIATPALATVTVNAVYNDPCLNGTGLVTVSYVCSGGEAVRAFALDIDVTGGVTIDSINDFNVGDQNGYGIFPGKFRDFVNAASPNWKDPCYIPIAPALDPGAKGGLGTSGITLEMGSLYVGAAPPSSGTLCVLDFNFHGAAYGDLTLSKNTNRGGVVLENGTTVDPVLNGTQVRRVYLPLAPATITYATADYNGYYPVTWTASAGATSYELDVCSPGGSWGSIYTGANTSYNEAGKAIGLYRYRVNASNEAGPSASWTYGISGSAVNDINVQKPLVPKLLYPQWDPDQNVPILWDSAEANNFNLEYSTDGGGLSWSSLYNGANKAYGHLKLASGKYRYRVRGANHLGTTDWNSPNYDCNVYLSTCYRNGVTTDPNWAQWIAVGRPDCWCKASTAIEPNGSGYQCDGDADGGNSGSPFFYRVFTGDAALLITNYKRTAAQCTADPNVTLKGRIKISSPCADFDHKSSGSPFNYRVFTNDSTILINNYKKLDSSSVTATNRLPGDCPR
jgi:hypothetical protein